MFFINIFGFLFFITSLLGMIFYRRNIIRVLISIELLLLSVNFLLIVNSIQIDDIVGQIFAILILTVAAAESAIGLSIVVLQYRNHSAILVEKLNLLVL